MFRLQVKNLLFYLGSTGLGQYFGRPFREKGAILCYHRVLPHAEAVNLQGQKRNLAVSDRCFDEHLKHLKDNYQVISMDEMHEHILSNSDEFYVAITFDDGYKDNLDFALPLLEKYDLPATVYITTRFPEGDGWMWWYEAEDFVVENDTINFSYNRFSINTTMKTNQEKQKCYYHLRDFLINNKESIQKSFLSALTGMKIREDYSELMLNWDEIRRLDNHNLITIGAHTHSHHNLKILDESEKVSEIKISKQLLEESLDHSVNHFAYPFGSVNTTGEREFKFAAQLGFSTAVTTRFGFLKNSDVFSLNRLVLSGFGKMIELEGKLSGFVSIFKS